MRSRHTSRAVRKTARYKGPAAARKKRLLCGIAALMTLSGSVLLAVRPWGMRFSGALLVAAAAALLLALALNRLAAEHRGWLWVRRFFYVCLVAGLALLCALESVLILYGELLGPPPQTEAAIVLGAGVYGRTPSLVLRTRLDAALAYLEEYPDIPAVLSGGQGPAEEISEAQCMYEYLTERGIDGGRLILEDQSTSTAENLAFSKPLLETAGIDMDTARVAVVTSSFHIFRAELTARRQGMKAAGVPAELPVSFAYLTVNYYLREAFALVKTVIFD